MKFLRETVSELMVRIHLITPELADYHVRRMTPSQVRQKFLTYVRLGLTRPGTELSAAGPNRERSTCLPSRFVTPATTQAGPRYSTPFPEERQRA
jgi:hypothetical protein